MEMLRVWREAIVSFPNFGYWRARIQIALAGHMPVSKELPYQWYDTPNVHHCTLVDFEALCGKLGFRVRERVVLTGGAPVSLLPNLLGAWPSVAYRATAGVARRVHARAARAVPRAAASAASRA